MAAFPFTKPRGVATRGLAAPPASNRTSILDSPRLLVAKPYPTIAVNRPRRNPSSRYPIGLGHASTTQVIKMLYTDIASSSQPRNLSSRYPLGRDRTSASGIIGTPSTAIAASSPSRNPSSRYPVGPVSTRSLVGASHPLSPSGDSPQTPYARNPSSRYPIGLGHASTSQRRVRRQPTAEQVLATTPPCPRGPPPFPIPRRKASYAAAAAKSTPKGTTSVWSKRLAAPGPRRPAPSQPRNAACEPVSWYPPKPNTVAPQGEPAYMEEVRSMLRDLVKTKEQQEAEGQNLRELLAGRVVGGNGKYERVKIRPMGARPDGSSSWLSTTR
ncbi:hypothetical protein C8J57DRAFT_1461722 [Mycena rebaudengoi]|nr:hypothetical protein C8J57DRAFT_1461722 [Mycena rebaudengoi]